MIGRTTANQANNHVVPCPNVMPFQELQRLVQILGQVFVLIRASMANLKHCQDTMDMLSN